MDEDILKRLKTMDAQGYAVWSDLHRRRVAGELLSEEESAAYEAGCQDIESTINYEGDIPRLRNLREQMLASRAVNKELREQEIALVAEIEALQARLDVYTRRQLGIED